MTLKFSKKAKDQVNDILGRYPTKQAAVMPVLFLAQGEFGHTSQEVMELVAETLELSYAHVYGVATFYTMYNKKPVGKYHIQLCRTLSCAMMGGEALQEYLEEKLNIKEGQTTADGKFTLATVECLASCGTAPMMQINRTYYENLTPEKVDQILEELK